MIVLPIGNDQPIAFKQQALWPVLGDEQRTNQDSLCLVVT